MGVLGWVRGSGKGQFISFRGLKVAVRSASVEALTEVLVGEAVPQGQRRIRSLAPACPAGWFSPRTAPECCY